MTFPPEPPADLDDRDVIRAHDWQAFTEAGVMQNHWNRPGWTEGRRSFHWMLSFHDAPAVQELARTCQAQFTRSQFDLVPLDALHLTIGRVAFTDELTRSTLDALTTSAAPRCKELPAFKIVVGPLAGSRGALRFSVAPWSPLLELHRTIGNVTREVLGTAERLDSAYFRPHLSIAYSNQMVPITQLVPQVEQLRSLPPVTTTIEAVSLVELRREERAYRYDELARMELGN